MTCAVVAGCGASTTDDSVNSPQPPASTPSNPGDPNPGDPNPSMPPPPGQNNPLPAGYTPTPLETIYTGDANYPICNDSGVMTAAGSITVNGVTTQLTDTLTGCCNTGAIGAVQLHVGDGGPTSREFGHAEIYLSGGRGTSFSFRAPSDQSRMTPEVGRAYTPSDRDVSFSRGGAKYVLNPAETSEIRFSTYDVACPSGTSCDDDYGDRVNPPMDRDCLYATKAGETPSERCYRNPFDVKAAVTVHFQNENDPTDLVTIMGQVEILRPWCRVRAPIVLPTEISKINFASDALSQCVSETASRYRVTMSNKLRKLECKNKEIAHAAGLEHLTGLNTLDLTNNALTSIDLSNQSGLRILKLSRNELTAIDISAQAGLSTFEIQSNPLSELKGLGQATQLHDLKISGTMLTDVDVSRLEKLTRLSVGGSSTNPSSQLRSLNLGVLPKLERLGIGDSTISALDLSVVPNLTQLDISNNSALNELNVSNLTELTQITISRGTLTRLDLSNQVKLESIDVRFTPVERIDLAATPELYEVRVQDAALTQLDVSQAPKLRNLELRSNQITDINVDANLELMLLDLTRNPLSAATKSYLDTLTRVACEDGTTQHGRCGVFFDQ